MGAGRGVSEAWKSRKRTNATDQERERKETHDLPESSSPGAAKSPLAQAEVFTSATRRDLPTPASPLSRATCPLPLFACSTSRSKAASSAVRPINIGQTTDVWNGVVTNTAPLGRPEDAER